jgi:hypothetical protein
MDLREIGYDMNWIKLAKGHVQWCALVSAVLKLHVLTPLYHHSPQMTQKKWGI